MRYYLETGQTDPAYNLAFEEYVLLNKKEGDFLLLWQNENAVIVGRNQNTEEEIDRAFVEAHGVKVVRRVTGGGAVYHDLGNLNYSFITDCGVFDQAAMSAFTEPVVAALRGLGLNAEASGRNDITVDGRKVSGTAQRIDHGRVLHHGTLLFDSDPSAVEGALKVDPEKFRAKGIQSVRMRIGNIRPLLKTDMTISAFRDYLLQFLTKGNAGAGALSGEELKEVLALRDSKYSTWEWNYGRSPALEMHKKKRFPAGTVEIHLSVRHGIIREIRIFGDFLALSPLTPLLEALRDTPYRKEDVLTAIRDVPFAACLGGGSAEEFVSVLFE